MTEWGKYQEEIQNWKAVMMPPSLNTPAQEFDRSMEEVQELHAAIRTKDPEQIGSEAVDVIIRMIGIATIVGCNVDQTLESKIKQTTQEKYPASMIRAHMDLGDTWDQAMSRQKTIWRAKKSIPSMRREPPLFPIDKPLTNLYNRR